MIGQSTVLILGAGASVHCGYPLGQQLVNELCQLRETPALNDLPNWAPEEANNFLTRLSRSGRYSIDAFLATERDLAPLGKYLIARQMKTHEVLNRLFPPNDSGWYQRLANALLGSEEGPDLSSQNLSVITFNYDRSLEAYLNAVLQTRFHLEEPEAARALADLPIVHVHGILGDYPAVPYEPDCDAAGLLQISSQIQIIYEFSEREGEFCSSAFAAAHDLLRGAERIFFLGFGFHSDNVRRLRFFTPANVADRLVRGTTAGMGQRDVESVLRALGEVGFNASCLAGFQCNDFFSHFIALE